MCPEGGAIIQLLARRIRQQGGAALIADYGHDGTKTDTFRVRGRPPGPFCSGPVLTCDPFQGFKGHRLHDVLSDPGGADLTADVDFSYLRRMAGGGVACLGPVTQRAFLKNMGGDARMQVGSGSDPQHAGGFWLTPGSARFCPGSAEELQRPVQQEAADPELRPADKPRPHGRALPVPVSAGARPPRRPTHTHRPEAGQEEPRATSCGRLLRAPLLLTRIETRFRTEVK